MNGLSAARLAALASSLGSADLALALALPVAAVGARFGSGAGFAAGLIAGAVQGALWVARGPGGSPASPALAAGLLAALGVLVAEVSAREGAHRMRVARQVWTSLRAGQVSEFLSYVLYQLREYQISATSLVESLALSAPKDQPGLAEKVERLRRVVGELNGKAARLLGENSAPTARRSRPAEFDVVELVRQAAAEAQVAFAARPVRIAVASEGPLSATGDILALRLSLLAVIQNALEACVERRHGSVSIVVHQRDQSAEIEIVDDAGGASVDQGTLFEPFYSARAGSAGMGLGLSMSRRMLDRVGGTLRIKTHGGALAVLIHFPLRRDLPYLRNDETTWAKRRGSV